MSRISLINQHQIRFALRCAISVALRPLAAAPPRPSTTNNPIDPLIESRRPAARADHRNEIRLESWFLSRRFGDVRAKHDQTSDHRRSPVHHFDRPVRILRRNLGAKSGKRLARVHYSANTPQARLAHPFVRDIIAYKSAIVRRFTIRTRAFAARFSIPQFQILVQTTIQDVIA